MKVGYLFQPSLLRVLPINVIDSHMEGFGVTSRYIYLQLIEQRVIGAKFVGCQIKKKKKNNKKKKKETK